MSLPSLANELLLMIANHLPTKDLNSLLQASPHLTLLLTPELHQRALEPTHGMAALSWAVASSNKHLAKLILDNGADVNYIEDDTSSHMYSSDTAIHIAAMGSDVEIVKLLLDYGASVTQRNAYDSTPLHDAAGYGCEAVVEFLLDSGADIDARDWVDMMPLDVAFVEGRVPMRELLLRRGASTKEARSKVINPQKGQKLKNWKISETISSER